ncbi:MAG TPA: lipid II flippase MurJ, partial [Patescibacteria group bacterium]
QASLPILSNNIAKNELEQFRSTVTKTILQSLFIALPLTVLTVILRVPLVRIAFGAKQFPWNATLITARTLAYLAPAIATQSVIQILIRSFYALHNTRTPLKISIVSLVVSIIIDYYSVKFTNMGIVGLALSDSVGNVILCFGLLYFFIKKVDGFNWGSVYNRVLRIVLSSGLMGVVIWFSVKVFDLFVLDTTRTLNLLVVFSLSSVIGLASYILFSSWFCKDELFLYQKYYLKLRQKYFNKQ